MIDNNIYGFLNPNIKNNTIYFNDKAICQQPISDIFEARNFTIQKSPEPPPRFYVSFTNNSMENLSEFFPFIPKFAQLYVYSDHETPFCALKSFNIAFKKISITLLFVFIFVLLAFISVSNRGLTFPYIWITSRYGKLLTRPLIKIPNFLNKYIGNAPNDQIQSLIEQTKSLPYRICLIPISDNMFINFFSTKEAPEHLFNNCVLPLSDGMYTSYDDKIPIPVKTSAIVQNKICYSEATFPLDNKKVTVNIRPRGTSRIPCGLYYLQSYFMEEIFFSILKQLEQGNDFNKVSEEIVDHLDYKAFGIFKVKKSKVSTVALVGDDEKIKKTMYDVTLDKYAFDKGKEQEILFVKNGYRFFGFSRTFNSTKYMAIACTKNSLLVIRSQELFFINCSIFLICLRHITLPGKKSRVLTRFLNLLNKIGSFNLHTANGDVILSTSGSLFGLTSSELDYLHLVKSDGSQLIYRPFFGWMMTRHKYFFDVVHNTKVSSSIIQSLNPYFVLNNELKKSMAKKITALKMFKASVTNVTDTVIANELGLHVENLDSGFLEMTEIKALNENRKCIKSCVKINDLYYIYMNNPRHSLLIPFNEFVDFRKMFYETNFIEMDLAKDNFIFFTIDPLNGAIFSIVADQQMVSTFKMAEINNIVNVLHPADRKAFKNSILHLLSSKTNNAELTARMMTNNEFKLFDLSFTLTSHWIVTIMARDVSGRASVEPANEMIQLVDIGMLYSNVLVWFFDDDNSEERIYTSMPIAHKPFFMNWTTIEMNVISESQPYLTEQIKATLEGKSTVDIEVLIMFDKIRWCMLRGQRSGKNGQLTGILVDLTELKSLSEQAELQKKRAEEANSAKSRFLANMSHEIRTPLNGMSGLLELLEGTNLQGVEDIMSCIRNSFTKLLELLNDTLDLAKIDQGKMVPQKVSFNTYEPLLTVIEPFEKRIQDADLKFYLDLEPDVPLMIIGDPMFLSRIVHNLLSLSLKYTDEGHIKLSISFDDEADLLTIKLDDTGIGLTAKEEANFFEPFPLLSASDERSPRGIGAGAALIKRLIDLLEGDIKLTTAPGEGLHIVIKLKFPSSLAKYVPKNLRKQNCKVLNLTGKIFFDGLLKKFGDFYGLKYIEKEDVLKNDKIKILVCANEPEKLQIVRELKTQYPTLTTVMVAADKVDTKEFIVVTQSFYLMMFHEKTISTILYNLKEEDSSSRKNKENGASRKSAESLVVLVAEDNEMNQLVARKLLEKLGMKYKIVGNGLLALREMENNVHQYNVILMDQQMPEMDGPEATRNIRRLQNGNQGIPIIAMTASIMKEDEDECTQAGMDFFVNKPVSIAKFKQAIEFAQKHPFNNEPC